MKTITPVDIPTYRRNNMEIANDVLFAIKTGLHKPTRIMYKSNLSWTKLQEIMDVLLEKNYVTLQVNNNRKRYYISPKGSDALAKIMSARSALEI